MPQTERRPLRIRVDQITQCTEALNKYMIHNVEDHYAWAQDPTFGPEFSTWCKEVFGDEYTDELLEEVKEYAIRMAGFLRDAFDEFKLGLDIDYKNVCPHCDAIHCFEFIAYDSIHWSCWCKNCAKLVRASDEEETFGV